VSLPPQAFGAPGPGDQTLEPLFLEPPLPTVVGGPAEAHQVLDLFPVHPVAA